MIRNVCHHCIESGGSETDVGATSPKNKTLYEESLPPTGDNRKADFHAHGGKEPALFTEKMIAGKGAL